MSETPPEPSEIARRIDATKKLLALHKRGHAQPLVRTQEDPDAPRPPIEELAAITKLEIQLANLEHYDRVRSLTTKRP